MALVAGLITGPLAAPAIAANGTWTRTQSAATTTSLSATWSTSSNWANNTVADGSGDTADFASVNITGSGANGTRYYVLLTSTQTIGNVRLGDLVSGGSTNDSHFIIGPNSTTNPTATPLNLSTPTGSPTITVLPNPSRFGVSGVITAPLSGTQGLTVQGGGMLDLWTGSNSITGGIRVRQGTILQIDNWTDITPASQPTQKNTNPFDTSNSLTVEDAQFNLYSRNTVNQQFNGLTYSGLGYIMVNGFSYTSANLNVGALNRQSNGVLAIFTEATTSKANFVTSSGNNAAGILGANVVFQRGANSWGYATVAAGGTASTIAGSTVTNADSFTSSTANYNFSGGATLAANKTAYTARYTTTATSTTTINSGVSLTLNGLMAANSTNNTGALTIDGAGSVVIGSDNELVAWAMSGPITIAARIADGAAAGSLTKAGASTLHLSGSNSFTGQTMVHSGTIALGNADALRMSTFAGGAGALAFNAITAATFGGLSGSANLALSNTGGAAVTLSVGNNNGSTTYAGVLSGGGSLAKIGLGRLTLSGSNTFTGVTTVSTGTLAVDGSLAASSGVSVTSGAELGGGGRVSVISGDGLVGPGNSPGILTGSSANLGGGLGFAFEFTQAGAPTWGATGTAVGNDILRLMDLTTPISGTATSANVFNIYFAESGTAGSITYQGGLFTDRNSSFESLISGATFNYFVRSGTGATVYNGLNYDPVSASNVTRTTVQVPGTTNFAQNGSATDGYTMQFVVVPEPGAMALAGIGIAAAAWAVRRRRAG